MGKHGLQAYDALLRLRSSLRAVPPGPRGGCLLDPRCMSTLDSLHYLSLLSNPNGAAAIEARVRPRRGKTNQTFYRRSVTINFTAARLYRGTYREAENQKMKTKKDKRIYRGIPGMCTHISLHISKLVPESQPLCFSARQTHLPTSQRDPRSWPHNIDTAEGWQMMENVKVRHPQQYIYVYIYMYIRYRPSTVLL